MKKFIALLSCILITMTLFIGCNKTTYDVSINTDIDTYHLAISVVQGITMTPEFKTNDKNINVEYYWSTTDGGFIGFEDKESVLADSIIWSPLSSSLPAPSKNAKVTVTVKEKVTGKVLGESSVNIEEKDNIYIVKK